MRRDARNHNRPRKDVDVWPQKCERDISINPHEAVSAPVQA